MLERAWIAMIVGACGTPPAAPPEKPRAPACLADSVRAARQPEIVDCSGAAEARCERRCDQGDVDACQSLAQHLDVRERQPDRAARLYRRGCELGALIACTNYGAHLLDEDPACATRLHRVACDGGEPWGCGMLGRALIDGTGVAADVARGDAVLREACERHASFPCDVLADYYSAGTLAAPSPDAARELYQHACATGDPFACDKVQPADADGAR